MRARGIGSGEEDSSRFSGARNLFLPPEEGGGPGPGDRAGGGRVWGSSVNSTAKGDAARMRQARPRRRKVRRRSGPPRARPPGGLLRGAPARPRGRPGRRARRAWGRTLAGTRGRPGRTQLQDPHLHLRLLPVIRRHQIGGDNTTFTREAGTGAAASSSLLNQSSSMRKPRSPFMVAGAHLVSVQDQAERGGVRGGAQVNGELGRWTYCFFYSGTTNR